MKKIMDSMTSGMILMIFDVCFGFCDFSASKMPGKMVCKFSTAQFRQNSKIGIYLS